MLGIYGEAGLLIHKFLRGEPPNLVPHFRVYDISTPVPRPIRELRLDPEVFERTRSQGRTITFDTGRDRLVLLGENEVGSFLMVLNGRTFEVVTTWDLQTQVPGFIAYAITYSEADDRFYLFGDWSGGPHLSLHSAGSAFNWRPAWPTGIVAVEGGSGTVAWFRPIAHCQQPMVTQGRGSMIARSIHAQRLYVPCVRLGPQVGTTGIARLTIDPDATQDDAASFPVDFFPVSGQYSLTVGGVKGMAAFDPESERVFLQSLAAGTPGAWVFDGQASRWVGHIASDQPAQDLGINTGNGHVYMGKDPGGFSQPGFFLVSDGRATPAVQGTVFPVEVSEQIGTEIIADPRSDRVLVPVNDLGTFGVGEDGAQGWLIVDDRTSRIKPREPIDYDELTRDIHEGPHTTASYAGGIGAFGSRFELVGGYGGPENHLTSILVGGVPAIPGVGPGDRAIFAARVPSIDLRNVGVSASAQAYAPDSLTSDELRTRSGTVAESGATVGDQAHEATHDAASHVSWPWRALACLVPDDQRLQDQHAAGGAQASVECDGAGVSATARARAGVLSAKPGEGIGINVGASAVESRSWKDASLGTVTEASARAEGFSIEIADLGGLSIEEVASAVRTVAQGRPGTNEVVLERTFTGGVVRDSDGQVVYACEEQCDPRALVDAANEQLETRVRLTIPEADITVSPRGAFAGVRETRADYLNDLTTNNDSLATVPALQAIVFNDTVEKSRLVVQLAGIEASSIYGISLLPEIGSDPLPDLPSLVPVPVPAGRTLGPALPPVDVPAVTQQPPPGPALDRLARGAIVLLRSPRDGFLVGLMLLLLGGPVLAFRRRLALMRQLGS